jgi:hypothetical protein
VSSYFYALTCSAHTVPSYAGVTRIELSGRNKVSHTDFIPLVSTCPLPDTYWWWVALPQMDRVDRKVVFSSPPFSPVKWDCQI